MLVVEGDFDHIPEIRAARDRALLFNAIVFQPGADGQPGTLEDFDFLFGNPVPPEGTTVNGQVQPVIRMRPGEVQRWRMVNSEFFEAFGLKLEGHRLHQIAADGIPLAAVRSVEAVGLSPGNRVDVLVQASTTPGDYRLVAPPYDHGYEYDFADGAAPHVADGVHLATIRVEGDAVAMNLPRNLDGAVRPRPIPDADLVPSSPRQLQFTVGLPDPNLPVTEPIYVRRKFGFNGERFSHTRIDHTPRLGTAEEWHLATVGSHPFHIHVNPFLVTEVGGRALRTPVWKDTILVPAGAGVRAKVRTRYDDFAGDFVLHCHILTHEDVGMMQRVRITE
jgi:FtsP/CotA-like multicopper oxidase with cupredoxin domain